ncbi:general secretion pathway protein GspB [Pseudoalteromonas fenneropenaei]|uniref:General secretion pathway protein GspB n=1 Tax=Pseudoalteromonas fenneropenaei TaxID=1737459 RepID=A0ABV7CNN9_9GAMM
MSFVAEANQRGAQSAQDTAARLQQAELQQQVLRYQTGLRRLGWGSAALICIAAGFMAGKSWQRYQAVSQPNATIALQANEAASKPDVSKENAFEEKRAAAENSAAEQNEVSAATNPPAKVNTAAVNQANQAKHYQWLSIQVGVDSLGQPIYQQQLVPITVDGQIQLPAKTTNNVNLGANNDIASLQQQGYRVVGKPLEQPATDDSTKIEAPTSAAKALQDAFAEAVAATENKPASAITQSTMSAVRVTPVNKLPRDVQASLPSFKYLAHIYATEPSKRWIKLNGRELYEGDSIGALQVIEITPELTVFYFDGIEFSMQAMEDWPPE